MAFLTFPLEDKAFWIAAWSPHGKWLASAIDAPAVFEQKGNLPGEPESSEYYLWSVDRNSAWTKTIAMSSKVVIALWEKEAKLSWYLPVNQ
jgi:hypothetical protein